MNGLLVDYEDTGGSEGGGRDLRREGLQGLGHINSSEEAIRPFSGLPLGIL